MNVWPEDEIVAVNEAIIAGKSDDEIRALVRELVAERARPHRRAAYDTQASVP